MEDFGDSERGVDPYDEFVSTYDNEEKDLDHNTISRQRSYIFLRILRRFCENVTLRMIS